MGKKDVVHIHNGIYAAIRKGDILSFATTWIELEHVMLGKIHSNIKTSIVYDITYIYNLKKSNI